MPKKRQKNTKKTNPRILILCEGKKTEPFYFREMKADRSLGLVSVDIDVPDVPKNTAKELVDEAVKRKRKAKKERNPYLEIWTVFDKDGYTQHAQAFDRAAAHNICIAFSSIAFEYWILLHFEQTTKLFERCDAVISHIKKQGYITDYEKGSRSIYDLLRASTATALQNAKTVRANCPDLLRGAKPYTINPFTNVDILVERLQRFEELRESKKSLCRAPNPAPLSLPAPSG